MDSPKDPKQLGALRLEQTYAIAGTNKFKNTRTGEIFDRSEFDEVDFKWRTDPDAWVAKHKGFEVVNGRIKNRADYPTKKRKGQDKRTDRKLRA